MKIKYKDLRKESPLSGEKFDFLAGESLNLSREKLFLAADSLILTDAQTKKIKKIEKLSLAGTPPEYIFKKAYFFGLDFYVNKNVLIPRMESEFFIKKASEILEHKESAKILDLGTGSGCLAVTLKKLSPISPVTASDISKNALKVANKNAKQHKVKIKFIQSDLFNNIPGRYDLITANLPYVDNELDKIEKLADPDVALDGGNNGFEIIEKALHQLPEHLEQDGLAIFEHGFNHSTHIKKTAKKLGLRAEVVKDLADYNRFALMTKA